MTYDEIMAAARECIGPYCKACPVCNGRACGNSMPGPGCKFPGNAAARNYDKWQELFVNMDTLYPSMEPDIGFELFGRSFSAPIFAAPIGAMKLHYGDKYTDGEYNAILIKAAYEYGVMAFIGDGPDASAIRGAVENMIKVDGVGCPTVKPWHLEAVFEKLDILNDNNIFAAAMDVDGAGLPFLKALNPDAGSKSVDELREIVAHAKMPFIIKGIMTPGAAEKAVESGARAIVVSNHGGRVQGGVPATAEVLPAIVEAVRGRVTVLVDGGIRSGVDVFRALALGADGVLIGRPVLNMIYGGGAEGFRVYMDRICGELRSTMTMCGAASLKDISRDMLWNGK